MALLTLHAGGNSEVGVRGFADVGGAQVVIAGAGEEDFKRSVWLRKLWSGISSSWSATSTPSSSDSDSAFIRPYFSIPAK